MRFIIRHRIARKADFLRASGNVGLINEISDHYADYKTDKITKGQYDARRKKALDQLKENIGPMEKLLFGKYNTP